MKKLTLILSMLIALVGLNANADMYIVGDAPFAGWHTNSGTPMVDNGDGTWSYVVTIENKNVYFSFANGFTANDNDWGGFVQYRFGPTTDGENVTAGEWITTQHAGNAYKFYGNGEYVFTFDVTNTRFKVEGYVAPIEITSYTVAGDHNNWNENDETSDMTLVNGVYTLVIENVALNAGNFEYKIVGNHDWGFEWPQGYGNNFSETVPANGNYDITITFDPETGESECTLTLIGEPVADSYTVAGTANMCGSNWDIADDANNMDLDEETGLYTWTKKNVELALGDTIEFKVVKNHSWDVASWPENNWVYPVPADGIYDFVITFNPETGEVTFTPTKQGGEEPPVEMVYTVVGPENVFGTDWDVTDTNNDMVLDAETGLYTWTKDSVALTTAGFGFKVVGNHDWANEWPQGMDNNWIVNIAEAGNYNLVITFNAETGDINCVATKVGGGEEPPVEMVYTVVGPEAIFGTNWDETDTNNDMVLDAETGLYTWTKDSVALTTAGFGFKVVGNHDWANEWPQGMDNNWIVNIAEAGNYNLVITFNAETGDINCVATKVGGGEEPPVEMVYTVAGDENVFGSNWNATDTNNDMVLDAETGLYTWTKDNVELNDKFEFKVVGNHDWANEWPQGYGNNWVANLPDGAGIYNIVITFNAETGEINCTLTKVGGSTYLRGDVDNDNAVTIGDVTALIRYLLSRDPEGINLANADCDLSGTITIGDVTTLIRYLLSKEWPAVEHTYTVAGTSNLCEAYWDPTAVQNDMVKGADGIYTLTKEGIVLNEGDVIEFKVVEDHSWDNASWPENNWYFYTPEFGVYNFVITFNPAADDMEKITLSYTKVD